MTPVALRSDCSFSRMSSVLWGGPPGSRRCPACSPALSLSLSPSPFIQIAWQPGVVPDNLAAQATVQGPAVRLAPPRGYGAGQREAGPGPSEAAVCQAGEHELSSEGRQGPCWFPQGSRPWTWRSGQLNAWWKVHGLGRGLTSGGERHLWTHSTDTGQEVNGSDDRFYVGGVGGG